MASYQRPTGLNEALEALDSGEMTIVAGGTDFYPARVGKPLDDDVLDVTALGELKGLDEQSDGWHIGALFTWTDLIRADLPPLFDALTMAAREVGGVQIQNAGTIVGNICNASPAADGVPCLLAMDSAIKLASVRGDRQVPLAEFIVGNRKTRLDKGEMVTGIFVPKPANAAHSTFLKLGARKYLVISIAMVAGVIEVAEDGSVADARIAVGACSEVARRLTALENDLRGRPVDGSLADVATASHVSSLTPIEDVRGTPGYRLDVALTLVRRTLTELGNAS